MRITPAALALLILAFSASAQPVAPNATQFEAALTAAQTSARTLFLSHAPGSPYLDTAVRLPEAVNDETTAKRENLKVLLEQGRDIQEGCALPCTNPAEIQVYAGKLDLIGQRLGVSAADLPKIRAHYIPEGRPRLKRSGLGGGIGRNPSADALDAEVTARLLQTQQLAPQVRAELQRKALAMADALGRTPTLSADSNGVVTFSDGSKRMLTAQQLTELNRIPQSQAQYLRGLAGMRAPPSPGERQAQILAEADRAVEEGGGVIGDTHKYWGQVASNPSNNVLLRGYARFNQGLLTLSGLKAVEESAGRLGYVIDNPEVSMGQKLWMGTKLVGNMALSGVSFLPAASFAKSVQAGEGFYWIGRGGTAVAGMSRAGTEVAQTMTATSRTLATTVAETLPTGAQVGTTQLRTMFQGLNSVGSRYGVTVVEGGVVGESVSKGGQILVNLGVGARHESVHVVQQVYSRVLAVEQVAAKYGTTVEGLTSVQRAEAFANAARWEAASYAQLESQAFRGTGFMGMGGGSGYTQQLLLTGQEVTTGMKNGAVLDGAFGLGPRIYGRLTQMLGHSQLQIGRGTRAAASGMVQTDMIRGEWEPRFDSMISPYTTPTEQVSLSGAAENAGAMLRTTAGSVGMFLPPSGTRITPHR